MSANDHKLSLQTTAVGGSDHEDRHRYVAGADSPSYDDAQSTNDARRAGKAAAKAQSTGIITVQPINKNEMQPKYFEDLGAENIPHGAYGSMMHGLGSVIGICGAIPCCPFPNPFRTVQQGQVGLVSRFGSFYKAVDPGLTSVNVCTESIKLVDIRIRLDAIPSQSVMTRDNVSVTVDSVICWHITSPYRAMYGIADVRGALIERAQTTLRQVVGARTLQAVVAERETIAQEIEEIVEGPAKHWGVAIESILVKDITFSRELQESLSSAAQAKRVGEAKVIAARAEVDAAKLMRTAADILASPAAMSIRTLDALQAMAKGANSKVVFVPMNLSNMGMGAPGQSSTGDQSYNPTFPQIAEQADEGALSATAGPSSQAGILHSMAAI